MVKPPSGSQQDCTSSLLDLLLGQLGNKLGLDYDRLRGQLTLAQDLKVPKLGNVYERGTVGGGLGLNILRNQRPQLFNINYGAVIVIPELVEMPHTDLTEVAGMVLVKENTVVVHTSSITPTTWMLPVLADTSMPCANVPSLLPVLLQSSSHLANLCSALTCLPPRLWPCLLLKDFFKRLWRFMILNRNPNLVCPNNEAAETLEYL